MEELHFVAKCGATYAQGYLFSAAVSIDELSTLLQPARLGAIAKSALKILGGKVPLTNRASTWAANG